MVNMRRRQKSARLQARVTYRIVAMFARVRLHFAVCCTGVRYTTRALMDRDCVASLAVGLRIFRTFGQVTAVGVFAFSDIVQGKLPQNLEKHLCNAMDRKCKRSSISHFCSQSTQTYVPWKALCSFQRRS